MQLRFEELELVHETAFLAMMADYQEKDPASFDRLYRRKKDWGPSEFKAFVKESQKAKLDWRPPANKVSLTRYVLLAPDGRAHGNGILRFPLDDETEHEGGNLLFDVPPASRGGDAEAWVVNGLIFEAVRAGLARVLVTCHEEDRISRRAIEMNRGELEDVIASKLSDGGRICRYWIRFR